VINTTVLDGIRFWDLLRRRLATTRPMRLAVTLVINTDKILYRYKIQPRMTVI